MKFAEFLQNRAKELNFDTALQIFRHYGGEAELRVSFRQFHNVLKGKSAPSFETLVGVFARESSEHYQSLIVSFFDSHLPKREKGRAVLEFVRENLSHSLSKGIFEWDKVTHRSYSDAQLSYLISSPEVQRAHAFLHLYEQIDLKKDPIDPDIISHFKELGLATVHKEIVRPVLDRFRLPRFGEGNSRQIAKANRFILNYLETFVSLEGSPKQEIAFATQFVKSSFARVAREQLIAFKKWIQSHVVADPTADNDETVPFVMVAFLKELEVHEFRD